MCRKRLLWVLCLSAAFWGFGIGISAAEKTYQVTETELTRLESNFKKLRTITEESKNESEKQKAQLALLKSQLSESESLLATQKASLQTASESLAQYAAEQKKIQVSRKRERTFWIVLSGFLLVRTIAK